MSRARVLAVSVSMLPFDVSCVSNLLGSCPSHNLYISAVSTGTHGKNVKCGTLSSLVQSMTLVLADGSIKNICLRDEQGCYSTEPLACAGE